MYHTLLEYVFHYQRRIIAHNVLPSSQNDDRRRYVFTRDLFNDTVSSSEYTESKGGLSSE
jgi:hypothetical protein